MREQAFLHCETLPAAGGMPVGTNGRAFLLLSGGIDSPVAGYMVAKRGVAIEAVHFFSYPYTGEPAKEKVLTLAKLLSEYAGPVRVHVVPFTKIQQEIYQKCPEGELTVIMRRFMTVSYTHLDVYKRQKGTCCAARKMAARVRCEAWWREFRIVPSISEHTI